jgi:hypothetical protein
VRTNYNGINQNGDSDVNWFNENVRDVEVPNNKGNNLREVEDAVDVEKAFIREGLVNAYITMDEAMLVKSAEEESLKEEIDSKSNYQEGSPFEGGKENDFKPEQGKKKKLSRGAIVGIILGSVAVVGIIVTLITMFVIMPMSKGSDTTKETTVSAGVLDDLQSRINVLYTDNLKSDIKDGYTVSDLDAFRKELKTLSNSTDISDVEKELNTIEAYMTDSKKIKTYADLSFNIEPSFVNEDCTRVIQGCETYTVAGLKATISNLAQGVLADRNNYVDIKKSLSAVSDASTFNEGNYLEKISSVKHEANKKELQSMYDKLVSDKNTALAEKKLKNAKDEAEKKLAQDALTEAQNKQKQAEKELSSVKKQLEDALKTPTEEPTRATKAESVTPTDSVSIAEENTEGGN